VVSLGWVDGDGMANSTKISDFRWDGIILWWSWGLEGIWQISWDKYHHQPGSFRGFIKF
jgi:hypothetical protein